MRRLLLFLFPVLLSIAAYSQEVLKVQNGASITVQAGAAVTVLGGITLDNGSLLSNAGTITLKKNGVSGSSDFSDNTAIPYSYGSGHFVFNSTTGSRILSNNNFGRIDVNAAVIDLNSTVNSVQWVLENGTVNTGVYAAIVSGTADSDLTAAPGNTGFTKSWINGNLRRYINPAAVDSYLFALGGSSGHVAVLQNLTAAPLTGVQYIDAFFGTKPGTDAGLVATEDGEPYVAVNSAGVWHFEPDNPPSAGQFDLQLSLSGFSGLTDNSFAILERPDLSADAADWQVPGGSSISPVDGAGRLVSDGYAERNGLSVLGQFGIGETATPLPVTLTKFDGIRVSKLDVQLSWQTQIESKNKGFGIERRLDIDTSFTTAGFIDSKGVDGNSAISLNYVYTDSNSYSGVTYYRLKQTNLDGSGYYSLIKAVNGFNGSSVSVMMWPNPTKGQFAVRIDGNTGNKEIIITDMQGKTIRRMNVNGNEQADIFGLAAGAYVVTIPDAMGPGANFNQKVLVIK
jgi:hypothetical protein